MCIVSGMSFPAVFVDGQTLRCPLNFGNSRPGASSKEGNYIFVQANGVQSNALSLFFTTPPSLSSGTMVKKNRVVLSGSDLTKGSLCEFSWGSVSPFILKNGGGFCDVKGLAPKTASFQVRINTFGQTSQWVVIQVPSQFQK